MKIKSIEIENFRAFSAPSRIDLDGKNLLVFGENGAGKSSIYHALHGFFSTDLPEISSHTNLFQRALDPSLEAKITVTFDDNQAGATWDRLHPGRVGGDSRVINAAQRSAILDYRSLLRTNFIFGDNPLNWFEVIHRELMPDFQLVGGSPTLREHWAKVQRLTHGLTSRESSTARRVTDSIHQDIVVACKDFTDSYRGALIALQSKLSNILSELSEHSVEVNLAIFEGLTFYRPWDGRGLRGAYYEPEITFRTLPNLDRPQLFLNEARLTQIALAIYLAGRKAVIPTGASPHLNLLVLDDVLIGLDHSNRVPLLKLLSDQFRDWQVVLLTHDRVWYEMARMMLYKPGWQCVEVIEGESSSPPSPFVRPGDIDAPTALLASSKVFLSRWTFERFGQQYKVGSRVEAPPTLRRARSQSSL